MLAQFPRAPFAFLGAAMLLLTCPLARATPHDSSAAPVPLTDGQWASQPGSATRMTPESEQTSTTSEPPQLFPRARLVGGYGGIDVGYTRLAGSNALLTCGGGAFIMNRSWSFGLMSCDVPTLPNAENIGDAPHAAGDRLDFGYGGVTAGYQLRTLGMFNVSASVLLGGGLARIVERDNQHWFWDDHGKSTDAVFVAEPRIAGYLNLTRWARAGLFAGYRVVAGASTRNLSATDLCSPVFGGTVQFGAF